MSIFVILGLLVCIEAPGSSAVTPVFVKKGDDLLLNVTEDVPQRFFVFVWIFKETVLVTVSHQGELLVSDAYTGRVEFPLKKFSVKLKNLQEADSGVYTAQAIGEVQQTLKYNVIVQAPVSPVGLTVDSVSSSSDSCNLTVTCSTQDSHISSTLRCDTQTCSQEGGERSEVTTSGASLHVYLVNDSIICNHSNQVSWTTNMMNIQDFCPQHVAPVSPVGLTVDSVSSSSDSCNLTVTCSTQDSHISSTLRCDTQTCSQEGGERSEVTTSGASLHVYLVNDSIICNHSNQVSWTKNMRNIQNFCPQHAGSSAVTPVFVKKGDDLLLNVTEDVPEDFVVVVWKFRENILATFSPDSKTKVSGAYTGRVETSVKKFFVKLKNLQEADSGVYTARVVAQEEQTLDEYNVTVQAPVSPVGLTVDSVSSSSDSCNLTVTCSAQDSHISSTLRCDTQTCSQEGGERSEVTTSGASLHVYLVNDSIICNHSNQVSWTENMTNIQDFCPQHAGISVCLVKTVVFSVGLIIMVSAVITVHIMEKLKKKKL
ncbi:hypothetical protein D5F01_LYC10164 [Larimichthys crocea]|uniref:Immunoglobulin domain-containing protein n=1 Tax=Larimichthys crocea TaxID=215358 RepID=A0A6G0IGA7_LARCR|nr:hypothetical protein D5F01_LYC10164 [Larimichthys crocea]